MKETATCPHCGASNQSRAAFDDRALLCGSCGKPIYNAETASSGKGRRKRREYSRGCGLDGAWWFFIIIIGVDTIGMLMTRIIPSVQQAREAGRQRTCQNNLRQIGRAMQTYHTIYGCFPPPFTVDKNGKPLHSWRVLILPSMGAEFDFPKIRLDEPWNSPHNRQFAARMPGIYSCPSDPPPPRERGRTSYLMVTGPGTVGDDLNGTSVDEIPDGPSNTLQIAETRNSQINWMQPVDFDVTTMADKINPSCNPSLEPSVKPSIKPSIKSYHPGLVNVLFCDGSVRSLSEETTTETLEAILTKDGGEVVRLPE